ncbi:oligosaccharide flippase family protein [Cloacibacterium normanense]|uniref:oligosaccharide flippase family protein n=1 Tax=Cloacibacterium normanense TaxID=237258 RepID=UPI00352D2914
MVFHNLKFKLKSDKLLTDAFWATIGNGIGKGLGLLGGIIIARFLGKEVYGEFGILKSSFVLFATFSSFGFGYTSTKFISGEILKEKNLSLQYSNSVRIITIFISILVTLLCIFFSKNIAENFLKNSKLQNFFLYFSFLIILNALIITQTGILAGYKKFKELAYINLIVGIVSFITTIIFTYYWGLSGAILSLAIAQGLNYLLNSIIIIRIQKQYRTTKKFSLENIKHVINFSLPVSLQEVLYTLTSWGINIIMIRLTSYGQVGLYNAAIQWNSIIMLIPSILGNVILSHMSSVEGNEKNKILKRTLRINFLLTFIPSLIMIILSPLIIKIYGSTYSELSYILPFCLISTVFMSLINVYSQFYLATGKNWILLVYKIFNQFAIIFLLIIFVRFFNLSGALSLVLSNLFISIAFLIILSYYYKIKINHHV